MAPTPPPRTPPRDNLHALDNILDYVEQKRDENRQAQRQAHNRTWNDFEQNEQPLIRPNDLFPDIDEARKAILNRSLYRFLTAWISETIQLFPGQPWNLDSHVFWTQQVRMELELRLWRTNFLGRDPVEDELDFLVLNAMDFVWPRVQKFFAEQPFLKRLKTGRKMETAEEKIQRTEGWKSRSEPKMSKLRYVFLRQEIENDADLQAEARALVEAMDTEIKEESESDYQGDGDDSDVGVVDEDDDADFEMKEESSDSDRDVYIKEEPDDRGSMSASSFVCM
ncbi:hypothetical protein BU26DRAFT_523614 [Trematosphaeria pertusa]|uniref:Uncharacterized protein n=1 Tax=Trematosphaeria pertusa TaxID=390896 RepID=A0A6A6HZT7_9PLEO|nr:uncharacterized protein BU26DRAFT_523614 [Trematosphaeria pertusa]KAF2243268.1 hypothetical protein BU26DRAFT_523614 [Trematosphaeria pertusa]